MSQIETRSTVAPLAHSIDEALTLVPISRTAMFELIGSGEIRSVKIGRRRLIPHSALVELIDGNR